MDLFNIEAYNFDLPESYIAKYPLKKRDEAKLLVVDKKGNIVDDTKFYNIIDYLNENDLLILNDSKVIKSRLYGYREKDNRNVEILLLDPFLEIKNNNKFKNKDEISKNNFEINNSKFYALIKNRKKFKIGDILVLGDETKIKCKIIEFVEDKIVVEFENIITIETLDLIGNIPIPPYFKRKAEEIDDNYYQTVYSNKGGSQAAPTAGLHFTKDLLKKVKNKIFDIKYVTLHVGWGTFSPIRTSNIKEHKMHYEYYELKEDLVDTINFVKSKKGRVIACGTTTLRALEGNFNDNGKLVSGNFKTNIYIYPGYKFNIVDSLITNFHTPKSSLLILVSAFAGNENIRRYYKYAIENNYRFFSYGDAMFII